MLFESFGLTEAFVHGKVCMDGGCGHGTFSYQLLKHGAKEVTGVDLHETLKAGAFESYPNMKFVRASLLDLPFADNTFDLIVSNGVLHHTADPEKCMKEYVRVLKPGGTVIVGVYGKHGLFPYTLSMARFFTRWTHLIPQSLAKRMIQWTKLSPMLRYQLLDYLYVPYLRRYTPNQIIEGWFKKDNHLANVQRIYGLSPERAAEFRAHHTVYTYDQRTLSSKILFGVGFIVAKGEKPITSSDGAFS